MFGDDAETEIEQYGEGHQREKVEDQKQTNTKKQTKWSAAVFEAWRTARNKQGDSIPPLEECDVNNHLARFVTEVRKPDGSRYPANSIKSIAFGLLRKLRNIGIYDEGFLYIRNVKFRKVLEAEIRKSTIEGVGVAEKKATVVSEKDEKELWSKGVFGDRTAATLQHTVFFYNSKLFGIRSSAEHKKLDCSQFTIGTNESGKYIEFKGIKSETNGEVLKCRKVAAKTIRHYNAGCGIVSFYEKYLDALGNSGLFYRRPLLGSSLHDKLCYTKQPVGVNTLRPLMKKLCSLVGLQGQNFHNSGKKTGTATFDQTQIRDLSGVPDQSQVPDLSQVPDICRVPDQSQVPDLSIVPDQSQVCDQSLVPDICRIPDQSRVSDQSQVPDLSPKPDQSQVQDQSFVPDISRVPDQSGEPEGKEEEMMRRYYKPCVCEVKRADQSTECSPSDFPSQVADQSTERSSSEFPGEKDHTTVKLEVIAEDDPDKQAMEDGEAQLPSCPKRPGNDTHSAAEQGSAKFGPEPPRFHSIRGLPINVPFTVTYSSSTNDIKYTSTAYVIVEYASLDINTPRKPVNLELTDVVFVADARVIKNYLYKDIEAGTSLNTWVEKSPDESSSVKLLVQSRQSFSPSYECRQPILSSSGSRQSISTSPGSRKSISASSGPRQSVSTSSKSRHSVSTSSGSRQSVSTSSGSRQSVSTASGSRQSVSTSPGSSQSVSTSSGSRQSVLTSPESRQSISTAYVSRQSVSTTSGSRQSVSTSLGSTQSVSIPDGSRQGDVSKPSQATPVSGLKIAGSLLDEKQGNAPYFSPNSVPAIPPASAPLSGIPVVFSGQEGKSGLHVIAPVFGGTLGYTPAPDGGIQIVGTVVGASGEQAPLLAGCASAGQPANNGAGAPISELQMIGPALGGQQANTGAPISELQTIGPALGVQQANTGAPIGELQTLGPALGRQQPNTGAPISELQMIGPALGGQQANTGAPISELQMIGPTLGGLQAYTGTSASGYQIFGPAIGEQQVNATAPIGMLQIAEPVVNKQGVIAPKGNLPVVVRSDIAQATYTCDSFTVSDVKLTESVLRRRQNKTEDNVISKSTADNIPVLEDLIRAKSVLSGKASSRLRPNILRSRNIRSKSHENRMNVKPAYHDDTEELPALGLNIEESDLTEKQRQCPSNNSLYENLVVQGVQVKMEPLDHDTPQPQPQYDMPEATDDMAAVGVEVKEEMLQDVDEPLNGIAKSPDDVAEPIDGMALDETMIKEEPSEDMEFDYY